MAKGRAIEIVLNSEYNNKDINRAINDLNSLKGQAGGAAPAMGGLKKAIMGVGAAAAGAFSIGMIVDFTKDAIQAGSSLMESQSKVGVVFGSSAGEIKKWADTSTTAMGMSKGAALEAAGTYGNLFQAFGITREKATDMSKSLVQLAADLASFNNTSMDDAIEALRSGLSGETEPLKRYGIAINDNRLKQEASSQAIYDGVGALDAAQKAQAAYGLIMKDSSLAQGDFARTSSGFANQMRIMQAEVENAKATIGVALVQAFQDVAEAAGGTGGAADGIRIFSLYLAEVISGAGAAAVTIVEVTQGIAEFAGSLGVGGDQLNLFTENIKHMIQTAMPLIGLMELLRLNSQNAEEQQADYAARLGGSYAALAAYDGMTTTARTSTQKMAAETAKAASTQKQLADALDAVKKGLSLWAAVDDYNAKLREIRKLSDEASHAIKGPGEAAEKNRDLMRSAFDAAANRVSVWAAQVGADSDQVKNKFYKFASETRDTLVKEGFKETDVDAFLAKYDIWENKGKARLRALKRGFANTTTMGSTVGQELADGVAQGIIVGTPGVSQAAIDMINRAFEAARKAAESKSPSKKFARLGKDLVKGTIQGVRDEIQSRRDALRSMYQDWYNTTLNDKTAARDQAQDARDNYETSVVDPLRDALQSAKDVMNSYKDSVKSSITGAISFGSLQPTKATVDSEGNETAAATTFMQNLKAKAEQAVAFAAKVKQLISMGLSEAGISQVLAAGADAGTAIADELINGGVSAITQTNDLMNAVSTAATSTADTAGATFYQSGVDLAASQLSGAESELTNFYQAGVNNAQAAIDGFNATYGADSDKYGKYFDKPPTLGAFNAAADDFEDFKDAAGKLIKKKKKKKAKGKASGGYVSADTAYFVGEEGPELFVPSTAGSIIPAGQSGGNTYKITVQAGVGDPRQIGQSVVEYIKRFEKANGPVFAKAG